MSEFTSRVNHLGAEKNSSNGKELLTAQSALENIGRIPAEFS